jgi:hypothetical protein
VDDLVLPPTARPPTGPGQFSLRALFVLMSLAALVTAAFVWDEFAGIITYLGCLLLVLSVARHRARQRLVDRPNPPAHLRFSDPDVFLLATIGVSLAAGIAFCCTCSFAQAPFARIVEVGDQAGVAAANRLFRLRLLVSIPLGTAAAACVFWLFWPRGQSPYGSE